MNYEAAAKYVATVGSRYEIFKLGLGRIVPTRRYRRGPTPGLTNPELTTRILSKDGLAKLEKDIEEGKRKISQRKDQYGERYQQ